MRGSIRCCLSGQWANRRGGAALARGEVRIDARDQTPDGATVPRFRLFLILAIAVGIAPGTLLRTPTATPASPFAMSVSEIEIAAEDRARFAITGAWELTSSHDLFGGFSGLVADEGGGLVAPSDRGWMLTLPFGANGPDVTKANFEFAGRRGLGGARMFDLEAITRDPAQNRLWAAYEGYNTIERFDPDGTRVLSQPDAMRDWPPNSGAEAMVRLTDGRFIVLGEGAAITEQGERPGLLFPGDPTLGEAPIQFTFTAPPGYSPVDMAQLPDQSVLILLRSVELAAPPRFNVAIMRADPARISPDEVWTGDVTAYLDTPLFDENFEGIAFACEGPDCGWRERESGSLFLIADDNFSLFQRSLLIRMDWPIAQRVRDSSDQQSR